MSTVGVNAGGARPGLVIFDCDGVLVDSERLVTAIEAHTLTAMGHPHTQAEVVAAFMGRSAADTFALLTDLLGPERAREFDERSTAEARVAFDRDLVAVPGIVAVLDAVESSGIPFCVASSGSHARMDHTLGNTGLLGRFAGRIHSAQDVERGKPWPDVFLHAAACEGASPADCVVIEDSVNGVLAARAAGMAVFGFAGGLAAADDLGKAGATPFAEMVDLPALLGLYSTRSA